MAIFGKIGEAVGGALEDVAGKALESMTGGFNLGDIGAALSGALNGDFGKLLEVGANALATKFLGPLGPKVVDIAQGFMNGGGLNAEAIAGALQDSGVMPGSDAFGAATNVFQGINNGAFSLDGATNLLAGLGASDENLLGMLTQIANGGIDINTLISSGAVTGGFAGGRGALDLLTRN